jgi:hypothetical protein
MAGSISNAAATPANSSTNPQQFLESVLPGVTNLTTNAYFGVGAGTPASGSNGAGAVNTFIGNRGADLYNQQANANQQTGLNDLLSTIGTYTSPALANQGQQLQNSQFNANLAQQGSEFQQQNQLAQFQAMLQALSLGNNITGQLPGNISSP